MSPRRPRPEPVPARLWALLTEASVVTSVAALPYALDLQRDAIQQGNAKRVAAGKRPIGPGVLAALTIVQGHIVFGSAAAAGLKLGRPLGLGAPRLEARVTGRRPPPLRVAEIARYVVAGLGATAIVSVLDAKLFGEVREDLQSRGVRPPAAWRGILAASYGSVAEEVLLRLGVQTALAAGLARITRGTSVPPSAGTMAPAVLGSSLLFGVAHLPMARSLGLRSRAAVARTLVINGVPGAAFGTLYWRRGLEAAMIAHAATALSLTVIVPTLSERRSSASAAACGRTAPSDGGLALLSGGR